MAPSPTTIPTSFVPKQPVQGGTKFTKTGGNTFLFLSLVILGIAILGMGGVFGYERFLLGVRDSKSAELKAAQASIDSSSVEEFIRTRDRFTSAKGLLDSHVAATNFFNLLESITLQTVRFNNLTLTLTDDRAAQIDMSGTARTFNALAAQSSVFAGEKRIKRAIFSDIKVNPDKTVSFALAADLDPKLLALSADAAPSGPQAPAVPVATSSAPSASSSPAAPITP